MYVTIDIGNPCMTRELLEGNPCMTRELLEGNPRTLVSVGCNADIRV